MASGRAQKEGPAGRIGEGPGLLRLGTGLGTATTLRPDLTAFDSNVRIPRGPHCADLVAQIYRPWPHHTPANAEANELQPLAEAKWIKCWATEYTGITRRPLVRQPDGSAAGDLEDGLALQGHSPTAAISGDFD